MSYKYFMTFNGGGGRPSLTLGHLDCEVTY